ncbi:Disease resistance protein Pik-1 [Euphorbia peplus]|nr:Disease resistance protein Pik-1 [Euphorbia peplus]
MKKKIVIEVFLNDNASRSRALKLVVGVSGVVSAGLGGKGKNQVEIVGDGVDTVQLATSLRKKFGHAEILSISDVVEIIEGPSLTQQIVTGFKNKLLNLGKVLV